MQRQGLVEELRRDGIRDERVLRAIASVPRHAFVPEVLHREAYGNYPLPIGLDQTISQPYVVAFMTEAARLQPGANVLEIGTGSGYQAAVLAEVLDLVEGRESSARLSSIEILPELSDRAARVLKEHGYRVDLRTGDGHRGWPERAPFDAIIVTAAPAKVPQALVEQLAVGGRMVVPVGEDVQDLRVLTRTTAGMHEVSVLPVRFVPMTGDAPE